MVSVSRRAAPPHLGDGARIGDEIWVSGHLGDAALALAALRKRVSLGPREFATVARRLHMPAPRIALGEALRKIARSAIDISDGLLADLGHICERSGVAAGIRSEEHTSELQSP